jgi:ATP-dependent helicase/nuclease subunit A
MNAPAYEHNRRPVAREGFYAIACDPRRSVAVEACAGAGKTWMLVSRIVRALLAGAKPQEILAITFTKKAAGEMRRRLNDWLQAWARADDEELGRQLAQRGLPHADASTRAALRGLYPALLAAGQPVQIRTFHSWFAALLGAAPLAVLERLGLPAHYELLQDDGEAIARVWRRFHLAVARLPRERADYEASVAAYGRSQTLKALAAALSKRVEFDMADAVGVVEASVKPFGEQFPALAGFSRPEDALAGEGARMRWMARAQALGVERNRTPQNAASAVVIAFETDDLVERLSLLRRAFFVSGEDRLTTHLANYPAAQQAEAELAELCAARCQHEAWLHHGRLARLARVLLREYAQLKREHGWIDMNDVERTAMELLRDPVLSGWVQERLDAQVRHLLVDEFQDTNPLQWQALSQWLESYAGAGAGAPSVFIVGDPKQSIYRFRRAEPRVFAAAQSFIADQLGGDLLSCDHTHRNAQRILAAVNKVMGDAQRQQAFHGFREHTTESRGEGAVLALPQIPREPRAAADAQQPLAWRDSLTLPRETPEERLATLESRQVAAWIAGEIAAGTPAGDILVLARRRDRLAELEAQLRQLHIPAQQPEKTDLAEQPEVQDITALLDVLVSTAHDLSLARVLKSPLFGAGDEALVELALLGRAQDGPIRSWWERLVGANALSEPLRAARDSLLRWKAWVDALPPHDALEAIYADGDVIARYAASAPAPLRASVTANVRAVPGAALAVQGGRYLTPYAFVRALKATRIPGPAIAAPGVVRLLTVHGAKGLEAPTVIVLDADGAPPAAETMGVLCEWPGEAPAPWRFAFVASENQPPPCSVDALEVELQARRREELNSLYVALTRAEHRLVISSMAPHRRAGATWWDRVLPLAAQLAAPAPPAASAASAGPVFLRQLPRVALPAAAESAAEVQSDEARFGSAVHRLLEFARGGQAGFAPARLRRVAREFGLDDRAMREAAAMAGRILGGEAAWAWDERHVDWQGNEVELLHGGERLRLDRLVRRAADGQWWVLDYKSRATPEREQELVEQMRRYRLAVEAAYPGAVVRTAFVTGQGRLVALD